MKIAEMGVGAWEVFAENRDVKVIFIARGDHFQVVKRVRWQYRKATPHRHSRCRI